MSLSFRIKACLTAAVIAPALVVAPNAVAAELPGSGNSTGSLGSLGSLSSSGSSTAPEVETYPEWLGYVVYFVATEGFPAAFLLNEVSRFNNDTEEGQQDLFDDLRDRGYIDGPEEREIPDVPETMEYPTWALALLSRVEAEGFPIEAFNLYFDLFENDDWWHDAVLEQWGNVPLPE
ncbi:hypothetical protein ACT3SZ_02835 [Corynebacterium sp. AOP40-9SA-29]|uniref:hypothetical protein n=1 Tax=Corynebacterium sp. AOP40-9SA-29 TaxID=3457677 RepID=UPI00403498B0